MEESRRPDGLSKTHNSRPTCLEKATAYYRAYVPRHLCAIDIELTDRCNLNCPSCWFHGENGVGDRYSSSELSTDEVVRLLDEVAPYRPAVYFGGAEPLLRDDCLTVFSAAKSRGLGVSFTTNGVLMTPDVGERLVDMRVDDISLSLDGPERVHDRLRGRGNFSRSLTNLQHLFDHRRKTGATKPVVTVNITINPDVVGSLGETIESVRSATDDQVDAYRIHHLWMVSADELALHQAAVKKALGCAALGAASHLLPSFEQIDMDVLCKETSRLRGADKVISLPDVWGDQVRTFYSEGPPPAKWCRSPFRKLLVKPDGEVRFCPDEWIDDYALGSIRDTGLGEIWRSRQARRFRRAIISHGTFPACRRCSWFR